MSDTKPQVSNRPLFPQRVYNVLQFSEEHNKEHIISWVNDGTAFRVHDVQEFERELLPRHFNTYKYSTFTRTLCAYGFSCIRTGRQTGIYSHPKFLRNSSNDVSLIKRVKRKSPVAAQAGARGIRAHNLSDEMEALNNRIPNLQCIPRDGNRMIMFPSLLDNPSPKNQGDNDDSAVLGQLHQTIRYQTGKQFNHHLPLEHEGPAITPLSARPSLQNYSVAPSKEALYRQDQFQERDDFEPIPLSSSQESFLRNKFGSR